MDSLASPFTESKDPAPSRVSSELREAFQPRTRPEDLRAQPAQIRGRARLQPCHRATKFDPGFRVPLLVVSAYNYRPQGSSGYISGACVAPGNCPNEKPPYIHDFGSILNFIEYAFGQKQQPLGEISPQYHYADFLAPDAPFSDHNITAYSLSDFFDFTTEHTFKPVATEGINYSTQCFLTPTAQGCFQGFQPADPDADDVDEQN